MIDELIARAKVAQKILETYSQEQIDAIVKMIAKVVYDNAQSLAELAIEESRMGVLKDKVAKNTGKSKIIWNHLKGKKSVGIINEDRENGIIEVAKPMGVVACVTPCTNPVVTPMCNAMFAIKCANTVIIAPHPRGKLVALRLKEMIDQGLAALGAPADIFQVIAEPSVERTAELMSKADVVIATGGAGMVKAAYSSGKPAFGVGPGNVQCIFDRGIDIPVEVKKALDGRIFDNGIICSGEQTIIAPQEDYDRIIAEFIKNGAVYYEDAETVDKLRSVAFPDGKINGKLVGQPPQAILQAAGLPADESVKVIIVKPDHSGAGELLSKEKMFPMMCAYAYQDFDEAIAIAKSNLEVEGKGHSVSIHSNDRSHIEKAGQFLPVSRVVVNQTSSTMVGGSFANGLNPTTTIGCGSWGNNSISENLAYFHLMNKTRISFVKPEWKQPSDEEIWG